MKAHLVATFFFGMILLPATGQEPTGALITNSAVTSSERQQSRDTAIRTSQMAAPAGSPDGESYPFDNSESREGTIVVDVWSPATSIETGQNEAQPATLSPDFTAQALQAAFKLQWTERKIENSIRRGFPVGEFWIRTDMESIDDSLTLAALSVTNKTDREALLQLQEQSGHLRVWSDWLIDANQRLALGDYLTSSWALDNDERFQNTVACTKFLVSMLSSRTLSHDSSCP